MGVKSTVHLSFSDAIRKYRDLKVQVLMKEVSVPLDLPTLERELEELNDFVNGGEGYENYSIDYAD